MRSRVGRFEAHVGGLAGAHRAEQLGLKRVRRQREEAGPFLGPEVGDRTVALFGVAPLVGDLVPPPAKLGVEVVEVAQRPGGKEGVAEVLDLALDLPLLVPARRRAGPGWPDLHYRTVTGALLLSPSPPRIAPSQLRLVE